MEPIGIILLVVAAGIGFRLLAGSMDGDRIESYVRERGGKVLEKHWAPFGKGWFGEKNDRIYEIHYEDRDGRRRRATVKTSLFSGVYLTEDREVERSRSGPAKQDETAALRAENARLKAELSRRQQSGD